MMSITILDLEPGTDLVIYVDESSVLKVQADANGSLKAEISAPGEFGLHTITIRYARDEKNVIDGTMFSVRHVDDFEKEKKEKRLKRSPKK